MSVALTADAVLERRKFVTRRMGWEYLKPGDRLQLCRKVQGRKPGEPLDVLAVVWVLSVRRTPLFAMDQQECVLEGLPDMTPEQFVEFFVASHPGATPDGMVTRIWWTYIDPAGTL